MSTQSRIWTRDLMHVKPACYHSATATLCRIWLKFAAWFCRSPHHFLSDLEMHISQYFNFPSGTRNQANFPVGKNWEFGKNWSTFNIKITLLIGKIVGTDFWCFWDFFSHKNRQFFAVSPNFPVPYFPREILSMKFPVSQFPQWKCASIV